MVKADGLAPARGVIVAMDLATAEAAVTDMLAGNAFGDAGVGWSSRFLRARRPASSSWPTAENVLPMATSQDHKRVGDGDTGLNTGGMGAYSPARWSTEAVYERIMEQVILPTCAAWRPRATRVHRLPVMPG